MIRKFAAATALVVCLSLTSCYTFEHQVGNGAQGGQTLAERQWFALWGLIPINQVDSHQLAGGESSYTVTTEFTPLDILISFFTGIVTVHVQTVRVEK